MLPAEHRLIQQARCAGQFCNAVPDWTRIASVCCRKGHMWHGLLRGQVGALLVPPSAAAPCMRACISGAAYVALEAGKAVPSGLTVCLPQFPS